MAARHVVTRRQFIGGSAMLAAVAGAHKPVRAADGAPTIVSVLTCPRPHGASYLKGTLAAIDADVSATVPRLLVCDATDASAHGWTSAVLPPRQRARGAFNENRTPGWVAVRAAWTMGADLLFLEDDIRPLRRGAFSGMLAHDVPRDAAFTSFFSFGRPPGLHGARDFRQSQAVKIPFRTLEALVLAEARLSFPLNAAVWFDRAIGVVGWNRGWLFEQTGNRVEHIGLWSAANPT